MSTHASRVRAPAFPDPSDGRPSGGLSVDDLESQYAAATLALWNARHRYLSLCEQPSDMPVDGMAQAFSDYLAARFNCAELLLSIEAIEAIEGDG
jgi:hypothetical protein